MLIRGNGVDITDGAYTTILSGVIVRFTAEEIEKGYNEWWNFIKSSSDFSNELITDYIYTNFADRVLLTKYADMFEGWDDSTDFTDYEVMVKNDISALLNSNKEKYRRLYDSMMLEYNPLWNVDGTVVTTSHTTDSGSDTVSYNGKETNDHKSTDTNTKTGGLTNAYTGSERDEKGQGTTEVTAATTFDSSTFKDTGKTVTTPSEGYDEHSYVDRADTTTYNNLKDEATTLSEDNKTFTNRNDKTDYGKKVDYTETVTRSGNIGVTKSTELIDDYRVTSNYSFMDVVARDIVNLITYSVY